MRFKPFALFKRPWWLAGGVLVAALIAGGGTWAATRTSTAAATTTLVTVSQGTIRQTVTASGTIAPARQADLSFTVSGTVTSVPAAVGDKVAKGETLATVGADDLQTAVDSAQASVDAAAEQVTEQQDASSTQLAAANAQLAAAKSNLTAAKQDLADATLTSPIAGTVASVDLAVGDRLGGSTGSSTGASQGTTGAATSTDSTAQVVVISTDAWVVDASVGSADLGQLKKALQVEITPTGSTTKVFGTVSSVGIVASSSTSGSATFPVKIAVTGSPAGLYAGATGSVAIIVKQLTGVLTVPTAAVHTVDGKTVVYQRKDGKQVNTVVKLGTAYGPSTQVVSGLKSGDQIVVESFRPGATTGGGERTGRTGGGTNGGPPGGIPAGGFPGGGFPAGGAN